MPEYRGGFRDATQDALARTFDEVRRYVAETDMRSRGVTRPVGIMGPIASCRMAVAVRSRDAIEGCVQHSSSASRTR